MLNRKNKRGCLVSGCVVSCVILLIILIAVIVGWMTCSRNSNSTELNLGDAVDNTNLSWTTGGNAEWFGQTNISFYDGDAAQSGAVTNYQSTWLRTSVTGPGTLTFYWKLSSGDGLDSLVFSIDGVQQTQLTGTVDWRQESYPIYSGEHDLEWKYTEAGSVAGSGWLDKVQLTPPGRGTLVVKTSPGNENGYDIDVYVDNEFRDTVEYYENIKYIDYGYRAIIDNLTEGIHTLKLTKVGYQEWMKQVSITTDETTTIYAYLTQGSGQATTRSEIIPADISSFGRLKVISYPSNVNVYIDGEFSGTPSSLYWEFYQTTPPPLLEGTYTLKLARSGYKVWTKQVSIAAGRTTTVYAYLEPGIGTAATRNETISAGSSFGTLIVNTGTLEGVSVYIDNEFGGGTWNRVVITTSPYFKYQATVKGLIEGNGLIEGMYTVKLTKSGYEEWTEVIEINHGLNTVISATLSKL